MPSVAENHHNLLLVLFMALEGVYECVIHVCRTALIQMFPEYLVDVSMECSGCVRETKRVTNHLESPDRVRNAVFHSTHSDNSIEVLDHVYLSEPPSFLDLLECLLDKQQ